MISLKNIFMSYTKNYYVLSDISLNIDKGEKIVFLGDEGSGKTSLIRIILGLEKNFLGNAFINNIPVKKIDFKNSFNALYISSKGAFLENKSAYANIEYVLKLRNKKTLDSVVLIHSALKSFGLLSYKDVKAKDLSNFNRIMLQLARANFREKLDLICIDDIFLNLSESERLHVQKHLNKLLNIKDVTSIIATSSEVFASEFGDKIIKFKLGSIEVES